MPSSPLDWTTVILLVQNAAVRLLTGVRRYDHITPVLSNLHWLPVHYRADFKMLLPHFSFMFQINTQLFKQTPHLPKCF